MQKFVQKNLVIPSAHPVNLSAIAVVLQKSVTFIYVRYPCFRCCVATWFPPHGSISSPLLIGVLVHLSIRGELLGIKCTKTPSTHDLIVLLLEKDSRLDKNKNCIHIETACNYCGEMGHSTIKSSWDKGFDISWNELLFCVPHQWIQCR